MCINNFEQFKKEISIESQKTRVIDGEYYLTKRFKALKDFMVNNASKKELNELKKLNVPHLFKEDKNYNVSSFL